MKIDRNASKPDAAEHASHDDVYLLEMTERLRKLRALMRVKPTSDEASVS